MPRKQFIADLRKAQQDTNPFGIHDLEAGEDDGQFQFVFSPHNLQGPPAAPVTITAMITDLSDYPKHHEYMIFCGEDAPPSIGAALQSVRGTDRKSIFELLDIISTTLSRLQPDADGDMHMPDSQFDEMQSEDEDEDDVYDDDFEIGGPPPTVPTALLTPGQKSASSGRAFRQRIRSDLRAVKAAGFKVAHLGHLLDGHNAFVTVSIRVSRLGISEEAMHAWQVDPTDYLILIIQYPNGYRTSETLQGYDSICLKPNIGMRICAGKKYKPTLVEAIKAFTTVRKDCHSVGVTDLPAPEEVVDDSSIRETFISKPMAALLEDRLIPILRFRGTGMDWCGAEDYYIDTHGASAHHADDIEDKYFEPETTTRALAGYVIADHFASRSISQYSFPLLAMQFLLRHFVRCTEFCLVCHRKMGTELEAIKPYVCDAPLCLFQYMAMGFGPSIEHEILAQPYVVDLLVSFCYNSATMRKLKDYPVGLALMVPSVTASMYTSVDVYGGYGYGHDRYGNLNPKPKKEEEEKAHAKKVPSYEVGFDRDSLEIIFFDKPIGGCPVARNNWIVIKLSGTIDGEDEELHCKITETTFFPTIQVSKPVVVRKAPNAPQTAGNTGTTATKGQKPATPAATPKWAPAVFRLYDQEFDRLEQAERCIAICRLLDTLPSVKDMHKYLADKGSTDLKTWTERISPAALGLLRWIIASNRACIMQVDGNERAADAAEEKNKTVFSRKQERLYGMKDYMQFRFAMGAPDKEQRFISAVRSTADRLSLNYPTLFAWHGSPLHNWHMIIREGLHFKNTDHGRAFGHGVYHATDAQTSTGYSGIHRYGPQAGTAGSAPGQWPNSVLRVSSALALNEIVNAPKEFVSQNPYYVVAQLDWIQTRYLFVQCSPDEDSVKLGREQQPTEVHPQDPQRTPKGIGGTAVVIPASAIKSVRAPRDDHEQAKVQSPFKKLKMSGGTKADPIALDESEEEDAASMVTDAEDLEILFDEPEPEVEPVAARLPPPKENKQPQSSDTDFVPGSLDFTTLQSQMMPMPTYANTATTSYLLKEIKNLHRLQAASSPAELGWYIEPDHVDNVYQWIVELHSFHNFEIKGHKLPLVEDMKKQNLTSIVLEIRFGRDFPFSPPYIRVVRPRFLSFAHGGGGHIVMGGAMCMELLTNTGWSSVNSMESVLMQVRLAIASEPPARLERAGKGGGSYGVAEAADGFLRACAAHGWTAPEGFREVAYGMGGEGSE